MSQVAASAIPIIGSVAPLAGRYRLWLCDIWGVLHNGLAAFPEAREACIRFRAAGGTVVLISNAPRPQDSVARQLASLGITDGAYDAIVTSGDVTRLMIVDLVDRPLFHLGPERDATVFAGTGARLADVDGAAAVVCTGLFDDVTETPDDYRAMLAGFRARGLPFVCANPDIVVERGQDVVYCAGALAAAYAALGGEVRYAGKPYRPIYERAVETAAGLRGRPLARSEILAIGDGLKTDLAGAAGFGIDALYVASGVHVPAGRALDEALLAQLFQDGARPLAATSGLRW